MIFNLEIYSSQENFFCTASILKMHNSKGVHNGEDLKYMLVFGKKLKDYKITELIKELQSRKSVSILKVTENQQYQVKNAVKRIKERGPATVLVIRKA